MTNRTPAGYYSTVNAELLGRVPVVALDILEVGCGTGALGAAFLRRQPRARWLGVEFNAAAAQAARAHVTKVACCDIESEPNPHSIARGSLDALVFGDVLEHLRDPWATLARLVPLLREGGVAIACLPNVGYWRVIAGLVAGRFDYADAGLLDRTHLRFFTLQSALELMRSAGLTPLDILPRRLETGNADMRRFMAAAAPIAAASGVTQQEFERNAGAFQYVIRAVKGETPSALDFRQMVFGPRFMDVRTVEPAALLASLPGVNVRTYYKGAAIEAAKGDAARLFIIQRTIPQNDAEHLESVARLIAAGYLVIADYDDHPDLYPAAFGAPAAAGLVLGGCHAVQTSTHPLATELRAWNPEVGVQSNYLFELPALSPRPEQPVTLFFGAVNREKDWTPHVELLNSVLAARPQVRVSVVYDRRFFERIGTRNKVFTDALPRQEYLQALHAAHVAWLPLADILVNRCKSDLKALEAGAGAVAMLAEETVYGASLRHGETAWLYRDAAGFEAGLATLLDDAPLRERLGSAARAWVAAERMAADHVEARRDWYLDLWSRRAALTEALYARMPQLRKRVEELARG